MLPRYATKEFLSDEYALKSSIPGFIKDVIESFEKNSGVARKPFQENLTITQDMKDDACFGLQIKGEIPHLIDSAYFLKPGPKTDECLHQMI